jgi:transposase InsO family protein
MLMMFLVWCGCSPRRMHSRRYLCQAPFPFRFAKRFFQRWQQKAEPSQVAEQFEISRRTVYRLFARFEAKEDQGIGPNYQQCGTHQAQQTDEALVQRICQARRQHPGWGSEMIRLQLDERHEGLDLPCSRTLRRHLQKAHLNPAPAGRLPLTDRPHVPRAERPHQGWQTDASEDFHLKGDRRACWLRIVDECSGAFLSTKVFEPARWENVDRGAIQAYLREVFALWGLPQRLRTDNGFPWGSTGDFPPEMALWLIGLGMEMIWIPPGCPQQNGVVERAQGTGKCWTDPSQCRSLRELQQRCNATDHLQRERYPFRDGRSRMQVYPQLRHSGRRYSLRWETQHWDLSKVLAVVSGQVAKRRVDGSGSISLYHRTRYVGKPYIRSEVYVSLDPTGPRWVIADADGRELRTHPADELTATRIRNLSVGCRKGTNVRAQ